MNLISLKCAIHYRTNFGECLIICGDSPSLGHWNIFEGIRLDYEEGDYWQFDILINEEMPVFKYKYVVCGENENQKPIDALRWEEGKDHCVNLKEIKDQNKNLVQRRDYWGYEELSTDELFYETIIEKVEILNKQTKTSQKNHFETEKKSQSPVKSEKKSHIETEKKSQSPVKTEKTFHAVKEKIEDDSIFSKEVQNLMTVEAANEDIENKQKDILFDNICEQIDPKKLYSLKKIKSITGTISGLFDIMTQDGGVKTEKFEDCKAEKVEFSFEYHGEIEQDQLFVLFNTGNILKPNKKEPNNIFCWENGKRVSKVEEPSKFVKSMILSSKKETGFVTKEDFLSLDRSKGKELLNQKTIFGVNILIISLYSPMPVTLKAVLKEKGFVYDHYNTIPENFRKVLFATTIFIFISTNLGYLQEKDLVDIKEYYNKGGSLYIFGDNDPYFIDANRISEMLFSVKLTGNDVGGKKITQVNMNSDKKTGFDPKSPIFSGIESLFEGDGVSYLADCGELVPLMWGSENHVIAAAYDRENNRCLIDGGFSRIFHNWDEDTRKFVINAIGWLSKIDLRFQ